MSAPLLPSPLDYVGRRPFAFYPPIAEPDPNEWLLGLCARAEVQVVNARTGRELWIPRQYIGAVAETDVQQLVVGLTKDLRLREGSLQPAVKRVITMPSATNGGGGHLRPAAAWKLHGARIGGAPVVAIRLESKKRSMLGRRLLATGTGAVALVVVAALLAAGLHF